MSLYILACEFPDIVTLAICFLVFDVGIQVFSALIIFFLILTS